MSLDVLAQELKKIVAIALVCIIIFVTLCILTYVSYKSNDDLCVRYCGDKGLVKSNCTVGDNNITVVCANVTSTSYVTYHFEKVMEMR
jgi:hypothetical protein